MSYVEQNLMPNERVLYWAKLHWYIYKPAATGFLLSVLFLLIVKSRTEPDAAAFQRDIDQFWVIQNGLAILFILTFLYAILRWIKAFIDVRTTEIAITTKRLMGKTGLISRDTVEFNHDRIDSLFANQDVMGRMLGFGTITIRGIGGGKTSYKMIADPLTFRRHALEAMDQKDVAAVASPPEAAAN